MATILLSAAGASVGSGFGGTLLGLSGAVIGRAVGATVGRAIDQRLLGGGSKAIETGRIDRLRLQTAGEGMPIARVWGQMRMPGHVIWASPLQEVRRSQGSGKGAPQPRVTEIGYMFSVALALCEGTILGVGRVWADGEEISPDELNMRVYCGREDQMPDPAIAAREGEDAPAYRGLAYVVMEGLSLDRWGNRMPQFQFEVTSGAQDGSGLCRDIRAVALIPGTGEYSLATTPVTHDLGLGETSSVNVSTPMGGTDLSVSLDTLRRELPNTRSVSLVVSWFGDDLRAGRCRVRPKVEQKSNDGAEMPWRVGGITRDNAETVARYADRPIYGGTPCDESVVEALRAIGAKNCRTMFYPFILMEQLRGNGLPDPYGKSEQDVMPWRGRITTRIALERPGSTDGSGAAAEEVAAFFGNAVVSDFQVQGIQVSYAGPAEWSYRRFILHYAHLCAAAGGVDAFLIGSEMVGLTRIRGPRGTYPAVAELRRLAADCRAILGPRVKIGYAADWSEYFGDHLANGDVSFHLDALWADPNIDFVGIDNYMPLSDWREGETHADASWQRCDNPDYLLSNITGGEGYDWYYASEQDRRRQLRTPIHDSLYGEHWLWRYKDLRGWWENRHHDRKGGVRQASPTAWVPGSKPIWFTEYGCAALDKATNQPNKFLDALSSESALPYFSNGRRNDALQAAYLTAVNTYWSKPENNPLMPSGSRMVDLSHAHVWCWDARPFPAFPAQTARWSDGPAWSRGHWLNGRAGAVTLSGVVRDICRDAGLVDVDTRGLSGLVRGFALDGGETGRAALQPLMLAYGFDAVERGGKLAFVMRDGRAKAEVSEDNLALAEGVEGLETVRLSDAEISGVIRLSHVEAGGDYGVTTAETLLPGDDLSAVSESEFPMALTRTEGREIAERWLAEALLARDTARFALPPSLGHLGPTDVISLRRRDGTAQRWRIDKLEAAGALTIDAVRVDPGVYQPGDATADTVAPTLYVPPLPMWPLIMDLPLIRGDEAPHAPHLAVTATPWTRSATAYVSASLAGGYEVDQTLFRPSIMGVTTSPLLRARSGVLDRGRPLQLRLKGGELRSETAGAVLSGANLLAIGDGSSDRWELLQFMHAQPTGLGTWEIWDRLRGQSGTDAVMPDVWPSGSIVVLLDGGPKQSKIPPAARGQLRHWRIGSSSRSPDDPSYRSISAVVRGVGFRPYAPCHLKLVDTTLQWLRRTRVDGDGWEGIDVPLGEARETYLVRLERPGGPVDEIIVNAPRIELPPRFRVSGLLRASVAQLSDQFGHGPFATGVFNVSV